MKTQYGITPAFADLLLSSLNGVKARLPIICAQLHDGDPGPKGTANPSTVTERQEISLSAPDSGSTSMTGGQPYWDITTGETLAAISLWSGYEDDNTAICMFTLPIQPGVVVAEGDVVILNTCNLTWAPAFRGLWTPAGFVEAPAARGHAEMLTPSVSASAPIVVPLMPASAGMFIPAIVIGRNPPPTMFATSQMFVPTATGGAGIAAPLMHGAAQAFAPTVSGAAGVTAPLMPAAASMKVPTVSVTTPVVAYDATGAGYTTVTAAGSVSASESHTATAGAAVFAVVTVLGNPIGSASSFTRTVKYGGTTMTSLAVVNCNNSTYGWIELFGLNGVSGGAQTVTATVTGGTSPQFLAAAVNSVSYANVASFGTAVTNSGASNSPTSGSVTSATGQRVVQAFAGVSTGSEASQSAYNQTSRWIQNLINSSSGGSSLNVTLGDATGASTVTFSETLSALQYWGSIAVPLNHH